MPLVEFETKYREAYERRRAEATWDRPLEPLLTRAEAVLARTVRAANAAPRCGEARSHGGRAPVARVGELVDAVDYLERIVTISGYPVRFVDNVVDRLGALFMPVAHRHFPRERESLDAEVLARFQAALELCADPWARNVGLGVHYDRIAPVELPPFEPLVERTASSTIWWTRGELASTVSCSTTELEGLADAIEGHDLAFVPSAQLEQLRDAIDAAEQEGEAHEYADLWLVPVDSEEDGEVFSAALDAYAAAVRDIGKHGGALITWTTKNGSL